MQVGVLAKLSALIPVVMLMRSAVLSAMGSRVLGGEGGKGDVNLCCCDRLVLERVRPEIGLKLIFWVLGVLGVLGYRGCLLLTRLRGVDRGH